MSKIENQEIVSKSKLILIEGLKKYITDTNLFENITHKINDLDIVILDYKLFEEKYKQCGGKGFTPGAFTYSNKLYFTESVSIHQIIHEMLHGISKNTFKNGFKSGLFVGNQKENYIYGRGFNEAFTEYLTSIFTNEQFSGYSKDFKIILELYMSISNSTVEDILKLYFQKKEWLSDKIIEQFDNKNKSLPNLIIEYDNKLSDGIRKINYNNVIEILIKAINNKIDNDNILNPFYIIEKIKELNTFFYDIEVELNEESKENIAITLDKLGMISQKKFK